MKQIVRVYNESNNELPKYASDFAAGVDLYASVPGLYRIIIHPGKRVLIHTGLYVAIPEGYELQIRPRSGLALKQGITVLNTPGTIDSDYRGEIGVILINHGNEAVSFGNGDRVAQAVLKKVETIEWELVTGKDGLSNTLRGEGGFGSSGIN
jgi:dUTP pyrophosphatase